MTDTTANLGLPVIAAAQAQKHVTHNEALRLLDTLVQLAVLDRDLSAPPGSPNDGERWIVGSSPSGAWAGHADVIAAWQDGAWQFAAPKKGWIAYIQDENVRVAWDGTQWANIGGEPPFQGTGTNDDAPPGYIGEYVKSSVALGSAVSLTTATPANVTSISLTAGDWDVWAGTIFNMTGTTDYTALAAGTSRTSATLPAGEDDTQGRFNFRKAAGTTGVGGQIFAVPTARMSLSATTTVYLVAQATFSTSTVTAFGFIAARRAR